MEIIGERLKFARKERGLSQVELAELVGVQQPDISKIEQGKIQRPTELFELARALRCSPDWLSRGDGTWDAYDWSNQTVRPVAAPDHWRMVAQAVATELKGQRVDAAAFLSLVDLLAEAIPASAQANEITNTARRHLRLVA